ncbi:MAG: CDP-alcohol phosphatidyltransferase family protein [Kiritimatiellaeota bacterium]|nr:CDP-alcohol phosphatidyltransferase family protein [Kiritimatiellota bacterium]
MSAYRETVKEDEPAIITERIARRVAYPVALFFRWAGWSANRVTVLAGACWIASVPVAVLAGHFLARRPCWGWTLWMAAGTLWNAGYVLDLADGSLARLTGTASPSGFYLDYVFHLLFKPMFLASIGVALYLVHGSVAFLLLAVLSIPANWSASASAAEHVLCELTGKKTLPPAVAATLPHAPDARLWLGLTDVNAAAAHKATRRLRCLLRLVAQEILSYYGQFTFFSVLVGVDLALSCLDTLPRLPATTVGFTVLTVGFLVLTPFRIRRDFRRF